MEYNTEILVIGSGISGLSLALQIQKEYKILIISKSKKIYENSSYQAQGGIAAVFPNSMSLSKHINDTIIAGRKSCKKDIVRFVVNNSKNSILWLEKQGVNFDSINGSKKNYHLALEGGHSERRVFHYKDYTGKYVHNILSKNVFKKKNITFLGNRFLIDLIFVKEKQKTKVIGAKIWNKENGTIEKYLAKKIVLATGGLSSIYKHTTNKYNSYGDGIACAFRIGCKIKNLAFNQFHPTCLYNSTREKKDYNFLITEAIRGEKAYLLNKKKERFMIKVHEKAELAPRDIVSKAIFLEMKKEKSQYVYLDATHLSEKFLRNRFPNIYNRLLSYSINISKNLVKVVPAAHYTCGGISTNKFGETNIKNLYAIGETTCTGLHGKNRLASNSLLECLVFAKSTAEKINFSMKNSCFVSFPKYIYLENKKLFLDSSKEEEMKKVFKEIQILMWKDVGIIQKKEILYNFLKKIIKYEKKFFALKKYGYFSLNFLKIRNLLILSKLVVQDCIKKHKNL
ncbi:L-aspartate oxidase [bacterium endosymbiont of Pedicinus badii]|uniref:L-aspartate oxidase n=1 Tax=bacterium endosymbiont of Pedicinus badii TaxID=1719126 RepID=UPI0009BC3983|nr:L-aspartate oxidase [bacterium endosymbiont of Pedicinus badii]